MSDRGTQLIADVFWGTRHPDLLLGTRLERSKIADFITQMGRKILVDVSKGTAFQRG